MEEKTCKYCGKIFKIYHYRSKSANYCSCKCKGKNQSKRYLGENNPCWRGGLPKCIDCGKQVSMKGYKRCNSCNSKLGRQHLIHGLSKTKEYKSFLYKKWADDHKMRRRILNERRHNNFINIEGSHSQKDWEHVKDIYHHMCLCCKRTEPEIKLTEDHIIPVSKGGSDYIWNIQPLCLSCNCRKHDLIVDYRINIIRKVVD